MRRIQNGKPKAGGRQRAGLPRILVVEANAAYRAVMSNIVEIAGGQFESVAKLDDARRQLRGPQRFEMVILGTSSGAPITPDQVGRLQAAARAPLIVMAELYDETQDTLEVYRAGADQVLPKPFVPDALVGAIQSGMRHPGPKSVVPIATRIELGSLVFDADKRQVTGSEGSVHLTKREWQLLSFFLSGPNQFFTAADAAVRAWGPDASREQFRSYIARLRKKLHPFRSHGRLVTDKAKGYCLVIAEEADT